MSRTFVECEICHKQGDGHWAGWHKKNIHDTTFTLLYKEEYEPPSESNKNSFKLCIPRSRDLYSAIFGCGINPQSRYHFGNMVMLSSPR